MQCIAIKKNGEQCKNNAKDSTKYCGIHFKNKSISSEIIDNRVEIDDTQDNMTWKRLFLGIVLMILFVSGIVYLFMNVMLLELLIWFISFPIVIVIIVNFMDGNSKEEMLFESGYTFISIIIGIIGILLPYIIAFGAFYLILKYFFT